MSNSPLVPTWPTMRSYLLLSDTDRVEILNESNRAYILLKFAGYLTGFLFVPKHIQIVCLCAPYQFEAHPIVVSIDDSQTDVNLCQISTFKKHTQLFLISNKCNLLPSVSNSKYKQLQLTQFYKMIWPTCYKKLHVPVTLNFGA